MSLCLKKNGFIDQIQQEGGIIHLWIKVQMRLSQKIPSFGKDFAKIHNYFLLETIFLPYSYLLRWN